MNTRSLLRSLLLQITFCFETRRLGICARIYCSWLSVARYGNSEGRTNRSKWYYFLFAFIWMNQTDRFIRSHLVFVSRIEGTWEINRSTGKYISFFFSSTLAMRWKYQYFTNIIHLFRSYSMRAKISLCYTRYKLAKALDYLRYICDSCERTVAYTYRVFILGLCTIFNT